MNIISTFDEFIEIFSTVAQIERANEYIYLRDMSIKYVEFTHNSGIGVVRQQSILKRGSFHQLQFKTEVNCDFGLSFVFDEFVKRNFSSGFL